MSNIKQVKVDNWGVFFLQRLKHFFNRTDYCDLTLQFEDCAQLKVHRLVLNACTEYFDLLERTCEIFEDVIIMPNDLQADVVVPIVNFMYTGQLEYDYQIFDRLYSTAQVMNMTVLTKLLDSQRNTILTKPPVAHKKEVVVMNEQFNKKSAFPRPSTSNDFSVNQPIKKRTMPGRQYGPGPGHRMDTPSRIAPRLRPPEPPRPTRYEVPDELDNEDIFESSFADISYESQPLMRTSKRPYREDQDIKPANIYDEASTSSKFEELKRSVSYKRPRTVSNDASEKLIDLDQVNEYAYQQKLRTEYIDQERTSDDENDAFDSLPIEYEGKVSVVQDEKDFNSFGHTSVGAPQTVSVKTTKDANNSLDHAKIISEVLKKYPHLVKSNKNIKLKILTGNNKTPAVQNKSFTSQKSFNSKQPSRYNDEYDKDWNYVSKSMNSEAMAKLVSKGAENTAGPWLCLICGTPGKALNFLTYHKFYRHLVDVHKERISANICEHCGYKSGKRNHLLHHMYTKHNVPPPSTHSFPKCTLCPYIALTEAFLIKHKMTHTDNREFSCSVCSSSFRTRAQLLTHIQSTGHKISRDKKPSIQCVYCNKIFLRETNLYTHLKLAHKEMARKDAIIDNSDEEETFEQNDSRNKYQDNSPFNVSNQEEHVNIKEEEDGKIQIISNVASQRRTPQKLLNRLNNKNLVKKNFSSNLPIKVENKTDLVNTSEGESLGNTASGLSSLGLVDRIVVLNENEYILQTENEDSLSMQHTIGHMQMEDEINEEIILSDIPTEHYETQQAIDMPLSTRTSQILSKSVTSTPKANRAANQAIQIMVSNNQPFKSIVSSAGSIVYTSNELKSAPTSATKLISSQVHNIDLVNSSSEVMVLQEDYNVDHAVANDGSNIVVLYSHPVEAGDNHILQVNAAQYEGVTDPQEVESNMERIHGEEVESETVLTEQGEIVETVEAWHEGEDVPQVAEEESQVHEERVPEGVEEDNEKSEEVHEESSLTDEISETLVTMSEEIQENVAEESVEQENENLRENETTVIENEQSVPEAETSELSVASDEADGALHVEEIPVSQEQAVVETCSDEATQNGVETVKEMEVDDSQEYQVQENGTAPQTQPKQSAQQLSLEWSDDETTKENPVASDVVEDNDNCEAMEVEESIENIEEEVKKQNEEGSNENNSQDVVGEKVHESADPQLEENDDTESSVETQNSQDDVATKEKSVEKITNLLNDWEDNDSQTEAMEVDGKKVEEVVPPKDSIHKLVSDWEDDEDK